MSAAGNIAAPRVDWDARDELRVKAADAARRPLGDRWPSDKPPGMGNGPETRADLEALHRVELQHAEQRACARAFDEEATLRHSTATAHATAAFRHSAFVPAGDRYGPDQIRPFLFDPQWPESRLVAERVSVADIRKALYEYGRRDAFRKAANEHAKAAAELGQLLNNLKRAAFGLAGESTYGGARVL